MIQKYIVKENRKHLWLFFAGWGMDETPFASLRPADADWMICYDYRSLDFDATLLQPYTHITVLAWSMGVWAASQLLAQHPELPIQQRIAINGTPFPVHETKGIAPAIFTGTLEGLNEASLQKFQRRMCSSAAEFKHFLSIAPKRPVEELKEELAAIGQQVRTLPASLLRWDKVYIGKNDRIFLAENQQNAWHELTDVLTWVEAPHYPEALLKEIIEGSVNKTESR